MKNRNILSTSDLGTRNVVESAIDQSKKDRSTSWDSSLLEKARSWDSINPQQDDEDAAPEDH